jgi:uncharacterized membrane protein YbhN (UPF0104 family)
VSLASIYTVGPQLIRVFASAPGLRNVRPQWFAAILVLETASFAAAWQLARVAVPGLSWRTAATAQLSANAAGRALPGGAVVAGAVYFRMLSGAGVQPANAALALAVNSFISNAVLFALPGLAVGIAVLGTPVPRGLAPVAVAGAVMFVLLFASGFILVKCDRPLILLVRLAEIVSRPLGRLLHKNWAPDPSLVVARREEMRRALGPRWRVALGSAAANWLLDYMALVAALYAVGARPRLSLVLLAYTAAAVLTMIPLTPGGLGFVEAGLAATLTAAGIPAGNALLATLAYRLFSFWLPLPAGAVAYLLARRRSPVGKGDAAPPTGGTSPS